MAARGAWALRNMEERAGLGRLVRTIAALVLAVAVAPLLFFSYLATSLARVLWSVLLERRFPGLEPDMSPSVRAATDTRRNQGIVSLLIHVRGRCDPDFLRAKFQEEVLERKNEVGELRFPRLRASLTSRWGHYAWRRLEDKEFRLDNHVVVGSQLFRGRAVSDVNIQDYVSDIVSKTLPAELPPWQLVLIPITSAPSAEPRFYVLLRLHHLLVDELEAMRSILAGSWGWGGPLVPRPRALPLLFSFVVTIAQRVWQELREVRDPVANPKTLVKPTLDDLAVALAFSVADASREVFEKQPWYAVCSPRAWKEALSFEVKRRDMTARKILRHVSQALRPSRLMTSVFRVSSTAALFCIRTPLLFLQCVRNPEARSLAIEASREILFWARVALDGPRIVFGELVRGTAEEAPPLVSLCGRRVVAWSEPAPVELVERIANAAGASPVEVLLAAACGALREHYRRQGCAVPAVPVQPLGASGVLLLPPTKLPLPAEEPLDSLKAISARLAASRQQPALLLASAWLRHHLTRMLPSLMVRLLLNCVTRRYAAIIMTASPLVLRRGSAPLWGYTVDNVLLWRPPQANISVSLSLVRVGSHVRLAVMADQQLWPHHAALPAAFLAHLRETALALGLPRSPRNSPPPPPPPTGAGPALLPLDETSEESLRHDEQSLVD